MPVAYNEIGCPLTYTEGRNFEWNGRELACVYFDDSDVFAAYAYNENGLRSVKQLYDEDNPFDPTMYYYFWSDDNRLLGYTCEQPNTDDYSVLVLYNTAKEPIGFTVEDETYYYIKNRTFPVP